MNNGQLTPRITPELLTRYPDQTCHILNRFIEDFYEGNGGGGGGEGNLEDIIQTTTSYDDGGVNIVTAYLSGGTTRDFQIRNGHQGSQGEEGAPGQDATIAVGTTTTLPAGSSATVTDSGTPSAAVLNFGIPKGDTGAAGADGQDGFSPIATVTKSGDTATISITDENGTTTATVTDGADGTAATVTAGTTTTLPAGSSATVTNSGTSSAAVFDFGIPKGDKGDTGSTGPAGPGVVSGGTTGQVLTKKSGTDYDTEWTTPATYSDFTGATSSVAGAHGLVPAPTTSDPDKFLKGDGTWGTPPGTTYTAGTGIDITGSTIAVDTSTVAMQSDLPTKTSDLINDGADNTSTYVEADDYATASTAGVVKVTGAFGTEMSNSGELKGAVVSTPDYPSMWNDALVSKGTLENALSTKINDATLTVTQNGTTAGTFTANSNTNTTIALTDTTYSAGEGININGTTINAKVRRVYDYYTSRPASANTTATGNGGMFTFQATSNMTTGKPKNDASILQLEWDNNAGHDTQLAMTPGVHGSWLAHRHQNSGTWGSWIYVLDDVAGSVKTANIDALAVTTAKIANGAVTATKIASGVLAYSTFEGLSGGVAGYWKRLGNVTFAQHQQGKSILLRILVGFGNNSNDHQQAFIDLVGQLAWTGSNSGRAGWTSTLNKMNTNATTSAYDIKVIANSVTSYDVYLQAAGTYMSATPIFIPGLHSDGTENAVWTPDYSAWTATAPSGTECDIANVSVAMQPDLPTVNDATLTITQNGSTLGTFTANASSNVTIDVPDTPGPKGDPGKGCPIGTILPYSGTTLPEGYLACDGTAVSRTTYSDLFSAIGTTYGSGDGSTTFNLPNLKGKVPVGQDANDTSFDALGETGGEKTHKLTIAEMPQHQHRISCQKGTPGNSSWDYGQPGGGWSAQAWNPNPTEPIGGNGYHNNLQPYIVINYIIKFKDLPNTVAEVKDQYSSSATDVYSANYVNSAIQSGSSNPTGAVITFAGSTAPTGYLICDGSAVSRTTYADLFTVIGTTYGAGDGSTTFNLPNLKGKVIVGQDAGDTNFDVLGETGGEKTHKLINNELPKLTGTLPHIAYGEYKVSGVFSYSSAAESGVQNKQEGAAGGAVNYSHYKLSIGNNQAHNNLQPYIVLNYIIKT